MRQKVRKKDKTAIALVLCFCVIALASVFTLRANINKVQAPAGEEVDAAKRVEETAKAKPEESAASVTVASEARSVWRAFVRRTLRRYSENGFPENS